MKHFLFALILTVDCWSVTAQNLVPNPSFEDTIGCPDDYSGASDEVINAKGWSAFMATPDYFNSCHEVGIVGVPKNIFGYQNAASGNAYCGLAVYVNNNPYWREIIGRKLDVPLSIGKKYNASFKISLADSCKYATNKIGMAFSTVQIPDFYTPSSINNQAKIYAHSIISDTANWITISGSFISDSSYNYIMIGNFSNDELTDTISFNHKSKFNANSSYYYIDDIYLSTDSLDDIKNILQDNFIFSLSEENNGVSIRTNILEEYSYTFFSLLGEKIISSATMGDSFINTTALPSGMYILQVQINRETFQQKLIIAH